MNRIVFIGIISFFLLGVSCGGNSKNPVGSIISVKTDFGEIKIKLRIFALYHAITKRRYEKHAKLIFLNTELCSSHSPICSVHRR